MTAIADAIVQLRIDLDDQDPAEYRWTDAELTEHLKHALSEYSAEIPLEAKNTVATVVGTRDLNISALTPRYRILAVEYPVAQYPPVYVPFSVWLDTLTMALDTAPAAIANTYIYWHTIHTLSTATSLNTTQLRTVLLGAAGHAASALASSATEATSVGGPETDKSYAAMSNRLLRQFYSVLRHTGYRARLRTNRLYAPADPPATQTSDPGP